MFKDKTIDEFAKELAGKQAVPGGGGASALCGALAVALGQMVAALTIGKKTYADVEDEIKELNDRAEELRVRLLGYMDEDAEAFLPLSKAYGLASETEEERAHKAQVISEESVKACKVPLDIMRTCCEMADIIEIVAEKGSRLARSDAGAAAALCASAIRAASLNVFINTKSVLDEDTKAALNEAADNMIESYASKSDEIFNQVKEQLI